MRVGYQLKIEPSDARASSAPTFRSRTSSSSQDRGLPSRRRGCESRCPLRSCSRPCGGSSTVEPRRAKPETGVRFSSTARSKSRSLGRGRGLQNCGTGSTPGWLSILISPSWRIQARGYEPRHQSSTLCGEAAAVILGRKVGLIRPLRRFESSRRNHLRVAQPGRASVSGTGDWGFESLHADHAGRASW